MCDLLFRLDQFLFFVFSFLHARANEAALITEIIRQRQPQEKKEKKKKKKKKRRLWGLRVQQNRALWLG